MKWFESNFIPVDKTDRTGQGLQFAPYFGLMVAFSRKILRNYDKIRQKSKNYDRNTFVRPSTSNKRFLDIWGFSEIPWFGTVIPTYGFWKVRVKVFWSWKRFVWKFYWSRDLNFRDSQLIFDGKSNDLLKIPKFKIYIIYLNKSLNPTNWRKIFFW